MEFRILGPLAVSNGGTDGGADGGTDADVDVDIGGAGKPRLLLALLLSRARNPAPIDWLTGAMWGDDPPPSARRNIQLYVYRLRRLLGPERILGHRDAYSIDASDEEVDALRFRRLTDEGDAALAEGSHGRAAECFKEALALWRAEPYGDFPECAPLAFEADQLTQLRIAAQERCAEAELALGRGTSLVPELSELARRHSLHERFSAQLMLALYRAGRRGEALEIFQRIRGELVAELGLEPGAELRELHRRMLAEDVRLLPEFPGPPSRLPPDIGDFVGRDDELVLIEQHLSAREPRAESGAVPVVVVSGQGGVGKSTLAVRAAHRLRQSYPGGSLYIGLRGTEEQPLSPMEALERLLRILGVEVPGDGAGLDETAGRFRQALQGRRLLVVLDDAGSVEQIRPLIPGDPGCGVIVTSRRRLAGLPSTGRVEMRVLSDAEGVHLLSQVAGRERVRAEPDEAAEVVRLCAGLPLAVRIAAARLATRPHWAISDLARRLADERRRLDELAVDDLDVRASVALGYRGLAADQRRALRLISLLGSSGFATRAVAALLDLPSDRALEQVEELVDHRLLEIVGGRGPDLRCRTHDLVRVYAAERAAAVEAPEKIAAAVERVAVASLRMMGTMDARLPLALPRVHRRPEHAGHAECGPAPGPGWLAAEEEFLVGLVERVAQSGFDELAYALTEALVHALFAVGNRFDPWNRALDAAHAAARAARSRRAEAAVESGLGQLRYCEDRFAGAKRHFTRALRLYRELGDTCGEANALNGLGTVHKELGEHREAIPLLTRARRLCQEFGDGEGVAHALYGLGVAHREMGADRRALGRLGLAVRAFRLAGHYPGEIIAIRGIGLVFRARGDLTRAEEWCAEAHRRAAGITDRHLRCYTGQALAKVWLRTGRTAEAERLLAAGLETSAELGDRFGTALALRTLGEAHLAAGRPGRALDHLHLAMAEWEDMEHDLWAARTHRDMGAAWALLDGCPAAHDHWRSALRTFTRTGVREAGELTAWRRRWGCHCDLPDVHEDR
ncbi:BTAD domain-containing putative transcriptional regulator [Microtetraspora sp. NBRC 16547]|uniref:AfsR/SARP family transcriptional regulator n=1 Tax=Microtetraspora sp. NBRC 16547 TaxID=3030993 RepID=UPI0024A50863|nr:BTAD domain-containing putative transcriptional regulator [Microtetraspora sp. NBRC 16547]GLW96726.1 SARP family transcriptional regulator [Microtetraspora sp. NBRC 16547]